MNPKFKVLIDAPCFNRSGYGGVSDGLVPMLLQYPHFHARLQLCNWGSCIPRQNVMPNDELMKASMLKPNEKFQPDIFIAINLPENIQPCGRIFNINFTAGLETDSWPDSYMNAMNKWDLTIFQSNFAKAMAEQSRIRPARKIEILPWCQDTNIFKIDSTPNEKIEEIMATVQEDEAFLYVGQRTHHNPWMDRKNVCLLIQTFCNAFKGREKRPALILKFNGVNFSTYDRNGSVSIIRGIRDPIDPTVPIYLLHGEMTDPELNALYNHKKIIACTSFTRGEGFGGSLLQSSLAGKPTIASNYSGHLDYLDKGLFIPLEGTLRPIPEEAVSNWFERGSRWFEINPEEAIEKFREFYDEPLVRGIQSGELAKRNAARFNLAEQQRRLYQILDKHLLGRTGNTIIPNHICNPARTAVTSPLAQEGTDTF